jgi:hypothetical protein
MFVPTHELALTGPALDACMTLPAAHTGVLVIKELSGPLGVPDFTALVGSRRALDARLACDVPPLLNRIDAAVVSVLSPALSRSIDAIAKCLQWPVDTIERRLPRLRKLRAVSEGSNGGFIRTPELVPAGRLYAVEAKVGNYTAGINQVRSYSVWADGYVLVMSRLGPKALMSATKRIDSDKGGLFVEGRWICKPRIRQVSKQYRLWATEHFVAGLRGTDYQPSVAP